MVTTEDNDIQRMLQIFLLSTYKAADENEYFAKVLEKCKHLMQMDYKVMEISNEKGELSSRYPSQLLILEYELPHGSNKVTATIFERQYEATSLRYHIQKSRSARCRARFPIPVILYKGKNICRSATLSCGPELYGRSGLDYILSSRSQEENGDDSDNKTLETTPPVAATGDWQLFDAVRNQDITLLKRFNVNTIVDLMIENKKVKFGMYVTSSEKIDKEHRYSDFNIVTFPYPGCEFFKDFWDSNRSGEGLVFNWNQSHVDSKVEIPNLPFNKDLKIDWDSYKKWDLIEITRNYMTYLIKYLQDSTSGVLIHCISGWDRTPLFISLLRLSLWADGVIHQSLNEHEILYLTIAYDWMLFGHDLRDRISKGEEIFFFCFSFLKYLGSDEFSVNRHKAAVKQHDKSEKVKAAENEKPVSVFRTDSDSQLELLLEDGLRGSNISLNSICSSVSTKSQDPAVFGNSDSNSNPSNDVKDETNGNNTLPPIAWSPQSKRTSPVSVPNILRQRQDSSSSGSWQVVTGTGSLRSTDHASHDIEEEMSRLVDNTPNRATRLNQVREVFYRVYYRSREIPYSYEPTLSSIIGNIAEKVGLSSNPAKTGH